MSATGPDGSRRNRRDYGDGASRFTARTDNSCPQTKQMIEAVVERENMMAALRRVEANKGSAGVDKMTVESLRPYLREHWPRIKEQLLTGRYIPSPVRRVDIPKAGHFRHYCPISCWTIWTRSWKGEAIHFAGTPMTVIFMYGLSEPVNVFWPRLHSFLQNGSNSRLTKAKVRSIDLGTGHS